MSVGLNGRYRLTVEVDDDFRSRFDDLKDTEVDITVKKHRERRSLDANAYCWVLLDKLADALRVPKDELYRRMVRDVGGNCETVCVMDQAVPRLVNGWEHNGLGWFCETLPSKLDGCTNVILYYGSSTYDTAQMSRLISLIVDECKTQGIETATPEEIAQMEALWANG